MAFGPLSGGNRFGYGQTQEDLEWERFANWYGDVLYDIVRGFRVDTQTSQQIYDAYMQEGLAVELLKSCTFNGQFDQNAAKHKLHDYIVQDINGRQAAPQARFSSGFSGGAQRRGSSVFGSGPSRTAFSSPADVAQPSGDISQKFGKSRRNTNQEEQQKSNREVVVDIPKVSVLPDNSELFKKGINVDEKKDVPTSELCDVTAAFTIRSALGPQDCYNVTLETPCISPLQAIRLVTASLPVLTASPKWMLCVTFPEVMCNTVPVPTGERVAEGFRILREKTATIKSFDDFVQIMIPAMNTSPDNKYISKEVFRLFNKYMRAYFALPSNPSCALTFGEWSDLLELRNSGSPALREYVELDKNYMSFAWRCLRAAMMTILPEEDPLILPEAGHKGILAVIPELNVVSNRYLPRDYGNMPKPIWDEMARKIREGYIIHSVERTIIFTNNDRKDILTPSPVTVIPQKGCAHPAHMFAHMLFSAQLSQEAERAGSPLPVVTMMGTNMDISRISWAAHTGALISGETFFY